MRFRKMSRVRVRRRRAEARVRVESRTREWGYRPRPAGVPSAVRLPRRAARSEGPAFLWNGLLDDYNSSPSVRISTSSTTVVRRSAHVDRSRSLSGDAGYAYGLVRGMIGARPMCDLDDVAGPRPRPRPRSASPRSEPSEDAVDKEGNPNANRSLNVQRAGATEPNGARFTSRPVVEVVL